MTCDDLRSDDVEAYVAGGLGDAEMTRVERHVFDCSRCFETLDVLRAARIVLKEPAAGRIAWGQSPMFAVAASLVGVLAIAGLVRLALRPVAPAPAGPIASTEPVQSARPDAIEAPALVAPSQVVIPRDVTPRSRTPAPRRPASVALKALVRFDAPPVLALTVRGGTVVAGEVTPELTVALRAYVRGDHREAFTRFAALQTPDRVLAAVQFYGGVSALKAGRTADARQWLTAATQGTHPTSAVEAWLYLGYAHLADGDAGAAVTALDRYIELDGDKGAVARQLRSDILAVGVADR